MLEDVADELHHAIVGYLNDSQRNLQVYRYHCSFHLGVFLGFIESTGNVYVLSKVLATSKDNKIDRCGREDNYGIEQS